MTVMRTEIEDIGVYVTFTHHLGDKAHDMPDSIEVYSITIPGEEPLELVDIVSSEIMAMLEAECMEYFNSGERL